MLAEIIYLKFKYNYEVFYIAIWVVDERNMYQRRRVEVF